MPVWYLLADDNGTPRCYLSGASIGRVMQGRSWAEIMGNYAPCADTDALCPGCALFGTVKGKGTSGRVRFTDAEAAQYESLGNKTLPILSGPKPSAYEFYLEKPKSTYETSIGFWNYDFCSLEETKYFPDGTKRTIKKFRVYTPQPRGRKFYWHSAPRTENERSNQNATLEAMKGTFKGSVYFDRITRAQLEELAFVLTLGENTPASPRLHKIGHGKPVGYGSCKITLTGGELRTLAQQDGTLCYTTEPLPLDSLLAAHGRIDTDSTSVKSLLKIADKRSTQSKTVEYPSAKDKNGNDKIFNWFSQNRKHAKSLVTLPHPLDNNITLEPKRGPDPAPRREGFAAPPRRESYTSTPQHEDAPLCVGRVYTGRVTGIKPYGAFVDLGSRRSGLVHIREIANHFVQSVDDELQIGQTVRVRVLDIKQEGGKEKISLSIKQA
ncbi:S1 RNA-binding domain-containing protein [Gemmiger formicilis]|uniref:S1 RNA-binding domain-containing protein n=1 Tax=Gemmiger formicilis TaxID=745368 RepID=UPI003520D486